VTTVDRPRPDPLVADLLGMWPRSVKALARILGVHPGTVYHWGSGRKVPSLGHLRALAGVVGADVTAHQRRADGCGTPAAYERHRRRGERCVVCLAALRPIWVERKRQQQRRRVVA
jgi:DNA-binding transcriptional regulator YdaS (Cro superfamily)